MVRNGMNVGQVYRFTDKREVINKLKLGEIVHAELNRKHCPPFSLLVLTKVF